VSRFDQIEQATLTDIGVRRGHNEDNLAVMLAPDEAHWRQVGHIFMVADGMGGHAVGEKASEMAAHIVPHTYTKHAADGTPMALRKAFLEANASIHACGEQNLEFRGMGTTGTALVLRPDGAWIAHVGDSRAYRIRNGLIEQLTYDHSYVWEYARQKNIDPYEVQDFPSNVIHRCLGPQPLVQVDIEGPHPIEDDDVFLLCSDGLSGPVSDHEMGVVASVLPPDEATRFLIDLANLRGGPDNITVLIIRVGHGDRPSGTKPIVPRKRRNWLLQLIPWPYLALAGGTALAVAAITLAIAWQPGTALAVLLFLLALIPISAGVVGMWLEQKRRRENRQDDDENHEPRVYRSVPCDLERPLLEKISKAAHVLKQRADDMQWEPDYTADYDQHNTRAEAYAKSGDLPAAFREYCLAMRPLSVALQKNRTKPETPQETVWEKSG
jgi:protein phosphatase